MNQRKLLVFFILDMMLSGLFCFLMLTNKIKTKQIIFILIYDQISTRVSQKDETWYTSPQRDTKEISKIIFAKNPTEKNSGALKKRNFC